ncbi:hypothetical protein ACO3UB_00695 [Methanocaldococcus sp. 16A]
MGLKLALKLQDKEHEVIVIDDFSKNI